MILSNYFYNSKTRNERQKRITNLDLQKKKKKKKKKKHKSNIKNLQKLIDIDICQ